MLKRTETHGTNHGAEAWYYQAPSTLRFGDLVGKVSEKMNIS